MKLNSYPLTLQKLAAIKNNEKYTVAHPLTSERLRLMQELLCRSNKKHRLENLQRLNCNLLVRIRCAICIYRYDNHVFHTAQAI
jgi:hypothetical protein